MSISWNTPVLLASAEDTSGFNIHTGNVRGRPMVVDSFGKRHQIAVEGDGTVKIWTRDPRGSWNGGTVVGTKGGKPHGCLMANGLPLFTWSEDNRHIQCAIPARRGWTVHTAAAEVKRLDEAIPICLTDGTILVTYEADGGAWVVAGTLGMSWMSWSVPLRVTGEEDLGHNVDPCIGAIGSRVWLTFHHESSVWWIRSEDRGLSWTEPKQVRDEAGSIQRSTADPNFVLYGTETQPFMHLATYLGNTVLLLDMDAESMSVLATKTFEPEGTFPQVAYSDDGCLAVIYNAEEAHGPGDTVTDDSSKIALWIQEDGQDWEGPWSMPEEESSTVRRRLGRILITDDAFEVSYIEHSDGQEKLFVRRGER